MSKKLLKKLLITVGIIDLFIMFLSILYFNNNIIESLYMIFNSIFINFNFIHLTGIVFLFAGFMIDTEQTDSNQNSIKKYIKLRRLGLILFISIISFRQIEKKNLPFRRLLRLLLIFDFPFSLLYNNNDTWGKRSYFSCLHEKV